MPLWREVTQIQMFQKVVTGRSTVVVTINSYIAVKILGY